MNPKAPAQPADDAREHARAGRESKMIISHGDLLERVQALTWVHAIDLGNGIGFAVVTGVGHLVGSAVDVPFRVATVAVWADGVIVRQRNYMDIDEARAAAQRLAKERG